METTTHQHDGFSLALDACPSRLVLAPEYDPDQHGVSWSQLILDRLPAGCDELVIDMAGFNMVDSRIFTCLIQLHRRLSGNGLATITLRRVGPRVRVGLDMLKLTPFFRFDSHHETPLQTCAIS